jgi:hypothetical protein
MILSSLVITHWPGRHRPVHRYLSELHSHVKHSVKVVLTGVAATLSHP